MLLPIGQSDAGPVSLDLNKLVDTRALLQANSGGGKSYLLRVLIEQAAQQVQSVVLDWEGEFFTLREKLDVLLVGDQGEIPAEPKAAGLLARRLLERRVSAVIDLSSLDLAGRRRYVRLFCESLLSVPRQLWRPLLVAIDEAHMLCPERSAGESEATAAVIGLMCQGRKRSFCGVLATQRLSKLHKDAAAEANNVFIGRTGLDLDQQRAGDLLGLSKPGRLELRTLDAGEWFAFGPAIDLPGVTRFQAAKAQTTHLRAGQRHMATPPAASAAIKGHLSELAELAKEADAEIKDLADAKKQLAELQRQLRAKAPAAADPKAIEAAEQRGEARGRKAAQVELQQAQGLIRDREGRLSKIETLAHLNGAATADLSSRNIPRTPAQPIERKPVERPAGKTGGKHATDYSEPTGDLTGPERRILNAIAWLESLGIDAPQQVAVAFLAGYSVGGGAFNNPRGSLNTKGLVQYVPGGRIKLTEAGTSLADLPDVALTTDELQTRVMEKLPGPERKILQVLLEIYPDDIGNEELAERSGYSQGGGAFNNPRGRLRSLGLVDYPSPGRVVACPVLFLEGVR